MKRDGRRLRRSEAIDHKLLPRYHQGNASAARIPIHVRCPDLIRLGDNKVCASSVRLFPLTPYVVPLFLRLHY